MLLLLVNIILVLVIILNFLYLCDCDLAGKTSSRNIESSSDRPTEVQASVLCQLFCVFIFSIINSSNYVV